MRGAPSLRAVITGRVQGIGFRPFVFRLAKSLGVTGKVANSRIGVVVIAQGPWARRFLERIESRPPPLSRISSFTVTEVAARLHRGFSIARSGPAGPANAVEVLPDLAICPDCRRDVLGRANRRFKYAFTNCTLCGPRYAIIEHLPYDRPATTMRGFRMCVLCKHEYRNPADRRFHAQPNACPDCGPELMLLDGSGRELNADPVALACDALARGLIVAVKSLGGFQLACDAANHRALKRLRRMKRRPAKPFALMCDSVAVVRRFAAVCRSDAALLASAEAPIVLLPKLRKPELTLSKLVAPNKNNIGVMLAYTPLHVVLFREMRKLTGVAAALVMTSANRKDAPIATSDAELFRELGGAFDRALTHNRPIANRCDDSVLLSGCPPVMVRRARGYAPSPVRLPGMFHVKRPVLAVGGDIKTSFALAWRDKVFLSPHIGSLGSPAAESFFLDTLERYRKWTGIEPECIACDLHPDYLSTRLAERLAKRYGLALVRIQHHFAHTVSVMAEHGLPGPVLGVAADGTGYGTDGAVWGCEMLSVQPDLSWSRLGHLGYLRHDGAGDALADPRRVAKAYLAQSTGTVDKDRGSLTSSLGRLFDAVAAITGVCRSATYEGQAPIALEDVADRRERGDYFSADLLDFSVSPVLIRPVPMVLAVSRETAAGVPAAAVAARFHNTVAIALARSARELRRVHGLTAVCLSGGAWQNRLLRDRFLGYYRNTSATYVNVAVPPNDGGVALGQAVIAGRSG